MAPKRCAKPRAWMVPTTGLRGWAVGRPPLSSKGRLWGDRTCGPPGTSPRGQRDLQEHNCGGGVFPALPGPGAF